MAPSKFQIGIIGGGAIGGYFASKFYLAGCHPILFIKNQQSHISFLLNKDGNLYKTKVLTSNMSSDVEIEYLFITVKTYSLNSVIEEYKDIINKAKYIILVQSNVNPLKYFRKENCNNVYFAPVLIGVIGNYNSIIYQINKGKILLGSTTKKNSNNLNKIKKIISLVAPTITSTNILFDLFVKVIINTSLIPLSVASCTSFGFAHKNKACRIFAANIFYECVEIARKEFKDNNLKILGYPLDSIDINSSTLLIKELSTKFKNVLPSVLLDILMEKKNTELPYFFEDIIEMGKSYNSDTTHIADAYNKLNYILTNNIELKTSNIESIMLKENKSIV